MSPHFSAASIYCHAELAGRLLLTQFDFAQRAMYLASRLGVGLLGSALRSQILHKDEALYMAELVDLEAHAAVLADAGAEGWVNLLRGFTDDINAAQLDYLEQVFGVAPRPAVSLLPPLLPRLAPRFTRFGQTFTRAVRERVA